MHDKKYPPDEDFDPDEAPFEPDYEHEYGPPQCRRSQ